MAQPCRPPDNDTKLYANPHPAKTVAAHLLDPALVVLFLFDGQGIDSKEPLRPPDIQSTLCLTEDQIFNFAAGKIQGTIRTGAG